MSTNSTLSDMVTERLLSFADFLPKSHSSNSSDTIIEFTENVFGERTRNDWLLFVMYGCILLLLNTLGIITNCITIYVFTRYPTKSSTYLLLQIMAIADSLFLLFSIFSLSVPNIYNFARKYPLYLRTWIYTLPYLKGFHEISRDYAVWMVAMVTIDRYIGICHPLKATRINIRRHAIIAALGLLSLIVAFNVPMFMLIKIIGKTTDRHGQLTYTNSALAKDTTFSCVYFVTDAILNLLVPIILVITMNSAIIRVIRRARQERCIMTRRMNENSNSHRTNIMLVIVAIVFVLCEVPKIVEQVLYFTGRKLSFVEYEQNIPLPVGIASEFLQNFNSFVNFYVYCLVGKKFQKIVIAMGCCQCKCCGKQIGFNISNSSDSFMNKTMSFRLASVRSRISSAKSNGSS